MCISPGGRSVFKGISPRGKEKFPLATQLQALSIHQTTGIQHLEDVQSCLPVSASLGREEGKKG
jgi:hypothetical protein